jgi:hypothetical protein
MLNTFFLLLLAIIARDVWCFSAAQLFCWRKRRQTQRRAQAELLQRRKEADEAAAQAELARFREESNKRARALLLQNAMENAKQRYGDRLPQYPLVIELETNHQFILTSREIVCMLRAQDRRRFLATENPGADN